MHLDLDTELTNVMPVWLLSTISTSHNPSGIPPAKLPSRSHGRSHLHRSKAIFPILLLGSCLSSTDPSERGSKLLRHDGFYTVNIDYNRLAKTDESRSGEKGKQTLRV